MLNKRLASFSKALETELEPKWIKLFSFVVIPFIYGAYWIGVILQFTWLIVIGATLLILYDSCFLLLRIFRTIAHQKNERIKTKILAGVIIVGHLRLLAYVALLTVVVFFYNSSESGIFWTSLRIMFIAFMVVLVVALATFAGINSNLEKAAYKEYKQDKKENNGSKTTPRFSNSFLSKLEVTQTISYIPGLIMIVGIAHILSPIVAN